MTDGLRGTRETPGVCSALLLAPLVEEFGQERVEIRMYHTPNLTGLRKRVVPKRINEGWGLQHMKLYGCDDEIIMSGYVGRHIELESHANYFPVPTSQTTTSPTVKIATTSSATSP